MKFYDLKECPYTPVKIKSSGWLEHSYLKKEDFTECYISEFENLKGIESIRYYPRQNFIGAKEKEHGKIELCNQEFYFNGWDIFLESQIFYLIQYNEKKYSFMSWKTPFIMKKLIPQYLVYLEVNYVFLRQSVFTTGMEIIFYVLISLKTVN